MNISGVQSGRTLTITVDFDEPSQVPIFNELFKGMLQQMADAGGGEMVNLTPESPYGIGEDLGNMMRSHFYKPKKEE